MDQAIFTNIGFVIFVLLAAHSIGDYPLQGEFLAKYKAESFLVLLLHSVIYSACIIIGFYIIDLCTTLCKGWTLYTYTLISWFMVISHIIIDWMKCRYRKYLQNKFPDLDDSNSLGHKYDVIGYQLDQVAHFLILLVIILALFE